MHALHGAMTFFRFVAIGAIFLLSTAAWVVLGASVTSRTGIKDASLNHEVAELWGGVHVQSPPQIVQGQTPRKEVRWVTRDDGTQAQEEVQVEQTNETQLPLRSTRIDIDMDAEHRQKGLLWFPTYAVDFTAHYTFEDSPVAEGTSAPAAEFTEVRLTLPSANAMYDGMSIKIDGVAQTVRYQDQQAIAKVVPKAGVRTLDVSYRSRGLESWTYDLQPGGIGMTEDIEVRMRPSFAGFDYPNGALSPSRIEHKGGTTLVWDFDQLISGNDIAIALPSRLNPGPIVSRITFFAPVSLFFFFVVLTILGVVKSPSLHPMHYLFLSASFFAFHLLLAYLVDHVNIHVAFLSASAVSIGLVTSYLRIVAGTKFALFRAGAAQTLFLVLFSYAFFFEGYAGLIVTIGAIVTLFVLMHVTATLDWSEVFSRKSPSPKDEGPYRTATHAP